MEALKIGILGTGVIAATLADTMNRMPGVELYGAASRSLDKAKDFGERFGVKRTYGSYEELAADRSTAVILTDRVVLPGISNTVSGSSRNVPSSSSTYRCSISNVKCFSDRRRS